MKNNIQNSSAGWAKRLQYYNTIHNRKSSKEENWKKLRERLDQSSRKKSVQWYRVAATLLTVLLTCTTIVGTLNDKAIHPGTGITDAKVFKDSENANAQVNTTQVITKAAALQSKHTTVVPARLFTDTLKSTTVKNDKTQPINIAYPALKDSQPGTDDIVHEPAALPGVHINDISSEEPLPQNISVKGLAVKKLIRLFGTDMTREQPPKARQKIPPHPYTIPDNQN